MNNMRNEISSMTLIDFQISCHSLANENLNYNCCKEKHRKLEVYIKCDQQVRSSWQVRYGSLCSSNGLTGRIVARPFIDKNTQKKRSPR